MRWSIDTLFNFMKYQWDDPLPSLLKWMPWIFPVYFFGLKKHPYKWALWSGFVLFCIYQMGLPLSGFRYYGWLCFMVIPALAALP